MGTKKSLHNTVIEQFNKAADVMGLEQEIRGLLLKSNNEIVINFPVKMDDGNIEMFTGYRVQHNNVLGPYKGGIRFHPSVDIDEIRALGTAMTWRTALTGIPFGGASGGVQFNPSRYSKRELEHITRRFTFALGTNIGPEYDIPEPDVNTDSQIMAWILDTYLSTIIPQKRHESTHVVTGKPVKLGGSLGRDKATGQGIVYLIERWAGDNGISLDGITYMVQGFGNVGSWTSRIMKTYGSKLVAVEDASGPILNKDGLDPDELTEYVRRNGSISGYPSAEPIDHEGFFSTEAVIFVPAALGNQITGKTALLLKVRLVAEGADGPTDTEGDLILNERGIDVLPDILCNSGGAIVSYFEWLQNKRSEFWDFGEVIGKLKRKMINTYERVSETASTFDTDWRTAAYIVALSRLDKVYKRRGFFP